VKIDKPSKPLPAAPVAGKPRANTAGQSATSAQADSTSVSLGAKATQLQSMENSMASTSVADPNKVAEIKLAISQGRFQVNSGVVADKLLESVKSLISNRG